MYKSTAAAQQFMERSGNFSTHATRGGRNMLGGGEKETMTPIQKRDALIVRHKKLTEELIQINFQRKSAATERQRQLLKALKKEKGIEYQALCAQLKSANEECGRYNKVDLGHFLIEVMRERLTRPEWEMVSKEARRRFESQESPPDEF